MEAETLPSLSSLLQGVDQWGEVLVVLPLLVVLEVVLSADNAIALAAISRRLNDPQKQRQALNFGLLLALGFRIVLIIAARWVLRFWPLQLMAAAYLLWLSGSHLLAGMRLLGPSRRPAPPQPPPSLMVRFLRPRRWCLMPAARSAGWWGWWSPSGSPIWPSRSTAWRPRWPSPTGWRW